MEGLELSIFSWQLLDISRMEKLIIALERQLEKTHNLSAV